MILAENGDSRTWISSEYHCTREIFPRSPPEGKLVLTGSTVEPSHFICSANINAPRPHPEPLAHLTSGGTASWSSSAMSSSGPMVSSSSASSLDPSHSHQFPTLSVLHDGHTHTPTPKPTPTAKFVPSLPTSDFRSKADGFGGPGPSSMRHLLQNPSDTPIPTPYNANPNLGSGILPRLPPPPIPYTSSRSSMSPGIPQLPSRRRQPSPDYSTRAMDDSNSDMDGIRSSKKVKGEPGRNLHGNSHISGIRVAAPEGGSGLWFIFTDLSVRQEGT
jgi:hypothetical protein